MFELLGPSVASVLEDLYMDQDDLESETILRVSKQLLLATAFLHETGYAHGGVITKQPSVTLLPRHLKPVMFAPDLYQI